MAETPPPTAHLALARKYRPSSFDDLVGQEALVTTLSHAFETGRIAHAYMLTGVRGVGKTTTARIIARALNYEAPGVASSTTHMPELGIHCQAIIESRHVDVIEMDAASHTGIDDIREITEQVRYKPAAARAKVFIIDEVHMLSKAAFNGLLKTLEEPPPAVHFIFATTEIRKVPVTILSRCQRFDLRRIPAELLEAQLMRVSVAEGRDLRPDAARLIARAGEGSMRDCLSLLDRALAEPGNVTPGRVRAMLGLADSAAVWQLCDAVFHGDAPTALARFGALHDAGAEPATVLADLAEAVHAAARVAAGAAAPPALADSERTAAQALGKTVGVPVLARAWQMLLKGLEETSGTARAAAAAEMVLIRLCHVAAMPTPSELAGRSAAPRLPAAAAILQNTLATVEPALSFAPTPAEPVQLTPAMHVLAATPADTAAVFDEASAVTLSSFAELVQMAGERRAAKLKFALEEHVAVIEFDGAARIIRLAPRAAAAASLPRELAASLERWTGARWDIDFGPAAPDTPTLAETRRGAEARGLEEARRHPTVQSALRHFPGASIAAVTPADGDNR